MTLGTIQNDYFDYVKHVWEIYLEPSDHSKLFFEITFSKTSAWKWIKIRFLAYCDFISSFITSLKKQFKKVLKIENRTLKSDERHICTKTKNFLEFMLEHELKWFPNPQMRPVTFLHQNQNERNFNSSQKLSSLSLICFEGPAWNAKYLHDNNT